MVKPPLRVDRHQIGAAAVGQRHLAHREQVLTAEQAGYAARDFGGDRRSIGEAQDSGCVAMLD